MLTASAFVGPWLALAITRLAYSPAHRCLTLTDTRACSVDCSRCRSPRLNRPTL
eukprot:XP_001697631.1 predicted protein [Chlamydomonas reinhardtii]